MSIHLKVTTEVLESKAQEVEKGIRDLQNCFNSIQDIVARSSGYWVGDAGDKARKEFNSQKDNTETVLRRFKEHPTDLLQMAGIYKEAEREARQTAETLSTDVIA